MSHGVTAYRVKWNYVEKYVYGSKNKAILRVLNYRQWHTELAETFKGSKSITPKKAAEEIINGTITRTNPSSGAMYRYVIEQIFHWGRYLLHVRKDSPWLIECEPSETILELAAPLRDNSSFYPIDFESVKKLFYDFDELPLPFPPQDDFPIVSMIRYEKLLLLQQDFSELGLPLSCHEDFTVWLSKAIEKKQDLVLYYS